MECPYCQCDKTTAFFQADFPTINSVCSSDAQKSFRLAPFEARICPTCFLVFQGKPLPDEEWREAGNRFIRPAPLNGIGLRRLAGTFDTVSRLFSKSDRLLHLDCAEGDFLQLLKEKGFENIFGIEAGSKADTARSLGLSVSRGDTATYPLEANAFDGIVSTLHLQEYERPASVLEGLKMALKPTGKILIEVPNFPGFSHLNRFNFNPFFFQRLCREIDLKVIEVAIEAGVLRLVIAYGSDDGFPELSFSPKPEFVMQITAGLQDRFNNEVNRIRNVLESCQNKEVFWWGGGNTSVTIFHQIDKPVMAGINLRLVDGDRQKWGLAMPGEAGLIVEPLHVLTQGFVDTLIVASSFGEEIRETLGRWNIHPKRLETVS